MSSSSSTSSSSLLKPKSTSPSSSAAPSRPRSRRPSLIAPKPAGGATSARETKSSLKVDSKNVKQQQQPEVIKPSKPPPPPNPLTQPLTHALLQSTSHAASPDLIDKVHGKYVARIATTATKVPPSKPAPRSSSSSPSRAPRESSPPPSGTVAAAAVAARLLLKQAAQIETGTRPVIKPKPVEKPKPTTRSAALAVMASTRLKRRAAAGDEDAAKALAEITKSKPESTATPAKKKKGAATTKRAAVADAPSTTSPSATRGKLRSRSHSPSASPTPSVSASPERTLPARPPLSAVLTPPLRGPPLSLHADLPPSFEEIQQTNKDAAYKAHLVALAEQRIAEHEAKLAKIQKQAELDLQKKSRYGGRTMTSSGTTGKGKKGAPAVSIPQPTVTSAEKQLQTQAAQRKEVQKWKDELIAKTNELSQRFGIASSPPPLNNLPSLRSYSPAHSIAPSIAFSFGDLLEGSQAGGGMGDTASVYADSVFGDSIPGDAAEMAMMNVNRTSANRSKAASNAGDFAGTQGQLSSLTANTVINPSDNPDSNTAAASNPGPSDPANGAASVQQPASSPTGSASSSPPPPPAVDTNTGNPSNTVTFTPSTAVSPSSSTSSEATGKGTSELSSRPRQLQIVEEENDTHSIASTQHVNTSDASSKEKGKEKEKEETKEEEKANGNHKETTPTTNPSNHNSTTDTTTQPPPLPSALTNPTDSSSSTAPTDASKPVEASTPRPQTPTTKQLRPARLTKSSLDTLGLPSPSHRRRGSDASELSLDSKMSETPTVKGGGKKKRKSKKSASAKNKSIDTESISGESVSSAHKKTSSSSSTTTKTKPRSKTSKGKKRGSKGLSSEDGSSADTTPMNGGSQMTSNAVSRADSPASSSSSSPSSPPTPRRPPPPPLTDEQRLVLSFHTFRDAAHHSESVNELLIIALEKWRRTVLRRLLHAWHRCTQEYTQTPHFRAWLNLTRDRLAQKQYVLTLLRKTLTHWILRARFSIGIPLLQDRWFSLMELECVTRAWDAWRAVFEAWQLRHLAEKAMTEYIRISRRRLVKRWLHKTRKHIARRLKCEQLLLRYRAQRWYIKWHQVINLRVYRRECVIRARQHDQQRMERFVINAWKLAMLGVGKDKHIQRLERKFWMAQARLLARHWQQRAHITVTLRNNFAYLTTRRIARLKRSLFDAMWRYFCAVAHHRSHLYVFLRRKYVRRWARRALHPDQRLVRKMRKESKEFCHARLLTRVPAVIHRWSHFARIKAHLEMLEQRGWEWANGRGSILVKCSFWMQWKRAVQRRFLRKTGIKIHEQNIKWATYSYFIAWYQLWMVKATKQLHYTMAAPFRKEVQLHLQQNCLDRWWALYEREVRAPVNAVNLKLRFMQWRSNAQAPVNDAVAHHRETLLRKFFEQWYGMTAHQCGFTNMIELRNQHQQAMMDRMTSMAGGFGFGFGGGGAFTAFNPSMYQPAPTKQFSFGLPPIQSMGAPVRASAFSAPGQQPMRQIIQAPPAAQRLSPALSQSSLAVPGQQQQQQRMMRPPQQQQPAANPFILHHAPPSPGRPASARSRRQQQVEVPVEPEEPEVDELALLSEQFEASFAKAAKEETKMKERATFYEPPKPEPEPPPVEEPKTHVRRSTRSSPIELKDHSAGVSPRATPRASPQQRPPPKPATPPTKKHPSPILSEKPSASSGSDSERPHSPLIKPSENAEWQFQLDFEHGLNQIVKPLPIKTRSGSFHYRHAINQVEKIKEIEKKERLKRGQEGKSSIDPVMEELKEIEELFSPSTASHSTIIPPSSINWDRELDPLTSDIQTADPVSDEDVDASRVLDDEIADEFDREVAKQERREKREKTAIKVAAEQAAKQKEADAQAKKDGKSRRPAASSSSSSSSTTTATGATTSGSTLTIPTSPASAAPTITIVPPSPSSASPSVSRSPSLTSVTTPTVDKFSGGKAGKQQVAMPVPTSQPVTPSPKSPKSPKRAPSLSSDEKEEKGVRGGIGRQRSIPSVIKSSSLSRRSASSSSPTDFESRSRSRKPPVPTVGRRRVKSSGRSVSPSQIRLPSTQRIQFLTPSKPKRDTLSPFQVSLLSPPTMNLDDIIGIDHSQEPLSFLSPAEKVASARQFGSPSSLAKAMLRQYNTAHTNLSGRKSIASVIGYEYSAPAGLQLQHYTEVKPPLPLAAQAASARQQKLLNQMEKEKLQQAKESLERQKEYEHKLKLRDILGPAADTFVPLPAVQSDQAAEAQLEKVLMESAMQVEKEKEREEKKRSSSKKKKKTKRPPFSLDFTREEEKQQEPIASSSTKLSSSSSSSHRPKPSSSHSSRRLHTSDEPLRGHTTVSTTSAPKSVAFQVALEPTGLAHAKREEKKKRKGVVMQPPTLSSSVTASKQPAFLPQRTEGTVTKTSLSASSSPRLVSSTPKVTPIQPADVATLLDVWSEYLGQPVAKATKESPRQRTPKHSRSLSSSQPTTAPVSTTESAAAAPAFMPFPSIVHSFPVFVPPSSQQKGNQLM